MKDTNDLLYTSCVPLETTQILSETFPGVMDNGVIPGDNCKGFAVIIP
jgi:hypothetical protein